MIFDKEDIQYNFCKYKRIYITKVNIITKVNQVNICSCSKADDNEYTKQKSCIYN